MILIGNIIPVQNIFNVRTFFFAGSRSVGKTRPTANYSTLFTVLLHIPQQCYARRIAMNQMQLGGMGLIIIIIIILRSKGEAARGWKGRVVVGLV